MLPAAWMEEINLVQLNIGILTQKQKVRPGFIVWEGIS